MIEILIWWWAFGPMVGPLPPPPEDVVEKIDLTPWVIEDYPNSGVVEKIDLTPFGHN